MISQHMLSDAQYNYLTSQNSEITNISEQRDRIAEKTDKMLNTLRIILNSRNIDQEFKDMLFTKHKITALIHNLISYDPESIAIQESNKQAIVIDLMEQSLRYFQDRYKEVFIKKEMKSFQQFAIDIVELTESKIAETKAQELFKTRKSLTPPLLYPTRDTWTVMCDECHKYTNLGKNEDDAIKRVRHSKNCSIHREKKRLGKDGTERIKIQYYKITPPLKKPKKLS